MKCVWYHPYFLCFGGSSGFLYMLTVYAGTLQTWSSVIIKVSKISKCAYKRAAFLISWIGWHLQSTNGSLVCWFKFFFFLFFHNIWGRIVLIFLKEFALGYSWGTSFSKGGCMFSGSNIEKYTYLYWPRRHTVCLTPGFLCNHPSIVLAFRERRSSDVSGLHNLGGENWMKLVIHHSSQSSYVKW